MVWIGIAAAIVAVTAIFARSQVVRSVSVEAVRFIAAVLKRGLCAPIAYGLDLAIGVSEKKLSGRLLIWVVLNSAFIVALWLYPATWKTLGIAIFGTLMHFAIVAIAVLVVKEETDVWDGLIGKEEAAFGSIRFTKNLIVLLNSVIFFFVFISLATMQWDEITSFKIVSAGPKIECESIICRHLSYLVSVGNALPGMDGIVKKFEALRGVIYTSFGDWFERILYWATWACVFGIFPVLYRQWGEINSLVRGLERATERDDSETVHYLQMRASRAPSLIKQKILNMAVNHTNHDVRHAAISVFPHAQIYTFPQTFVYNLHHQIKDNKIWGLRQIDEFADKRKSNLALDNVTATRKSLSYQTGKNRPAHVQHLGALRRADALLVKYAELENELANAANSQRGKVVPNDHQIAHLVMLAEEESVRRRAFDLALKGNPFTLCRQVVKYIGNVADDSWREEVVSKCIDIVIRQRDGWQRGKKAELRGTITKALREPSLSTAVKRNLNGLLVALDGVPKDTSQKRVESRSAGRQSVTPQGSRGGLNETRAATAT